MPNMVKNKTSNKGNEDNENIQVDSVVSSQAAMTLESRSVERVVHITINTIENIVRRDSVTITILVYHNDILLGESQSLRIEPDFREPPLSHSIDYLTEIPIILTDRSDIEAAISTPLLIQVIEHEANDAELRTIPSAAAGDNKKKDISKSAETTGQRIVGLCNIDLIPMLLGEKSLTERLIVEKPDNSATSWMNLPVLTVTLTQEETDFLPSDLQVNYLSVTVESIYNPPVSFAESFEYNAATIIYIDDENPETLIFDGGKFSKYRDVDKTKCWRTLNKLEGRARLSKYKIDRDYANTKNPLENHINLKKLLEHDNPRIEWNSLSRHILLNSGEQATKDKINKYKYWPFQFMTTINLSEGGKTKSMDQRPQFYQCYADVSELLYPGRTQTRTIAQLYTFNSSDMLEKTGLDKVLFTSGVASETKQKEKKEKFSAKGGSSVHSAPTEPEVSSGSSALINERGEPVFVVIQFELKVPLIFARTAEEVTHELHELLLPQNRLPAYPYTGDLPEEQYSHCIRKSVETIIESYRDFDEENGSGEKFCNRSSHSEESTASGSRYPYIPDEIDQFTQYLRESGIYMAVRTTLKKKISRLLDQKFKMQTCTWSSEKCQNLVATSYLYLVEKMHEALDSETGSNFDNGTVDADNLCYIAEESYELGNIPQAKKNYTSFIAAKRKDPAEAWLRYAIFSKKIGDIDRAVECCREAINWNARHKLALLLYGVILAEREDYEAAETFLKATTQLYPRFAEGWAILHLFYLRNEYYPGVEVAYRVAEQCLMDRDRDKVHMDCLEKEPLAWSTIHCPKDRVYLTVVVFLLKLNLLDFAGIALARELALSGRSTSWLYYMAVHHYLLSRFDDALTHLKEAQYQHGMDYSISGLMGHCHFKEGNSQDALKCYEFASTLFNRPPDIHLIDLRLGNYYLDAEEYNRAKKMFLSVCKSSPSSNSWLGLGTACYNMMEFKDAETALTEANRLDHHNPEIWAYLCLLNMTLYRHDEFAECYRQTVKNNLPKAKLWLLVTNTMESLGLVSPMLLSAASGDAIVKESSEESNIEMEETPGSGSKSEFVYIKKAMALPMKNKVQ